MTGSLGVTILTLNVTPPINVMAASPQIDSCRIEMWTTGKGFEWKEKEVSFGFGCLPSDSKELRK